MLPARYYDRVACYNKVYITSNIPLEIQYSDIQISKPETWSAFKRRINYVEEYSDDGSFTRKLLNEPKVIDND